MSFYNFDEGPVWDEFKWEDHLNEIEQKSEALRKFITSDPNGDVPRWVTLIEENGDKLEAVEAFIEEELLLDDAYFPEDEDDWEEEDDRKSTRLNSSHVAISYAVFCLKKKKGRETE